jgi:hypothetical protein
MLSQRKKSQHWDEERKKRRKKIFLRVSNGRERKTRK